MRVLKDGRETVGAPEGEIGEDLPTVSNVGPIVGPDFEERHLEYDQIQTSGKGGVSRRHRFEGGQVRDRSSSYRNSESRKIQGHTKKYGKVFVRGLEKGYLGWSGKRRQRVIFGGSSQARHHLGEAL